MFSDDVTNKPATRMQGKIKVNEGGSNSLKTTRSDKEIWCLKYVNRICRDKLRRINAMKSSQMISKPPSSRTEISLNTDKADCPRILHCSQRHGLYTNVHKMHFNVTILDAFWKAPVVFASFAVCLQVTAMKLRGRFGRNLVWETYNKCCRKFFVFVFLFSTIHFKNQRQTVPHFHRQNTGALQKGLRAYIIFQACLYLWYFDRF